MVVALHCAMVVELGSLSNFIGRFGVGVDLFFVISGFIIVYASRSMFGQQKAWQRFLALRIIRIVPLYWIALTLRLGVLLAGHVFASREFPGLTAIFTSFLFIPYDSLGYGDDYPFPILDLGWSLNYEIFFYFVLSTLIFLPINRAVFTATLCLTVGVFMSWVWQPPLPFGFWLKPIIMEFVGGMCIALIYIRGWRISLILSGFLVLVATYLWFIADVSQFRSSFGPGYYDFSRFFFYGMGAIALVSAVALSNYQTVGVLMHKLAVLGDSSYALYLSHPFVLLLFKVVFHVTNLKAPEGLFLFVVMIASCVALAHLIHLWIEKPLIELLKRIVI